jgi:hypothetical protein
VTTSNRSGSSRDAIAILLQLGDHIANALERAAAAEQRARDVTDPELRLDNQRMAESWRMLARSFQFVDSLQQFVINSNTIQQQDLRRLEPPKRHPWE